MILRKIILAGIFLLMASGCAPAAARATPATPTPPAAPTPGLTAPPVSTAVQPFTPGPAGNDRPEPARSTQVSGLEKGVPLLPSRTLFAAAAPSKTPGAAPSPESLAARLGKIAAVTPPRDYRSESDFYSAAPDLKEFNCFAGKTEIEQQACLREAGLYYYQLYQDLPYMWGGNYPYAYSVAAALKAAGDPFLNLRPINIATVEEDRVFAGVYQGRSGKPMKAGFDCSGFTFWIMAHAGQPDFLTGQCADPALAGKDYHRCDSPPQMQAGRVIPAVGDSRVPIRTILQYGAPGDLIFTEDHVMFYLGEGEVVQSVDAEWIGGDGNPAPPEAWLREWADLHPELKMVQRGGVNRTELEHMGATFWIRRYTIPETR